MNIVRFWLVVLMILGLTHESLGAIVISVGNGSSITKVAGQSVAIPIFAYNNGGTAVTATGFTLGLDFSTNPNGYDGYGVPGDPDYFTWAQTSFTTTTFSSASAGNPVPGDTNFDLYISGSKIPGVTFAANQTLATAVQLGTLTFNTSAQTPAGVYGLKFVFNALDDSDSINSFGNVGSSQIIAHNGGGTNSFTITAEAVPEPSTMALIALGLTGGAAYRRFRKRSPGQGSGTAGS